MHGSRTAALPRLLIPRALGCQLSSYFQKCSVTKRVCVCVEVTLLQAVFVCGVLSLFSFSAPFCFLSLFPTASGFPHQPQNLDPVGYAL